MTNLPIIVAILLTSFSGILCAQKAKVVKKNILLNTYPFSDPDPIPRFEKIFPYYRFDGYSEKGIMQNWKMVELENDYIRLWIVPEIGGKIWGAIEKSTGKEFIYYNHAVKFRDIAMRGPWTSGGIEINFGIIGHAPTTSSPVDYYIRENDNESVSCFVGAFDLTSRTRWTVEINLPPDKAYFTTRSIWDNPTCMEQSYYHWMNLGVKTSGNLEYIFPGNYYLGHGGEYSPWPIDGNGRNLSFYEKNNFGGAKSYHVFGKITDFYGAYWHDDHFGFGHYSPYDEKPGKKIWIWGLADDGMIWENLLTDTDGQYTEIQSGRLYNQGNMGSSRTPFKSRSFTPGTTDEWTEYWYPVKETEGLKISFPQGSLNLRQNDHKINLWFCPNEETHETLEVRDGKKVVYSKRFDSLPMQVVTGSFDYTGDDKDLCVWLGNKLIYDADPEKNLLKRPVESPGDFNWNSAYGHYLQGRELRQHREYKEALAEYEKSLKIDPWYLPALTGMSDLACRRLEYQVSLEYARKALSVDTYDPEANMMYGLSSLALGDTISAIDGFSIASAGISRRSAACNALASIWMNKGNYERALSYAEKSLITNQSGSEAIQLKIHCLLKMGRLQGAEEELSKLEQKDPLNHFSRFERYLISPGTETAALVHSSITAEFPQETFLEYALWYYRNGQLSDASKILELGPEDHPVVLIWRAYLDHLKGNEQNASLALTRVVRSSPYLIFPFRAETLQPLTWARSVSDDWKLAYYAGLIYLAAGNKEKGKDLWESCGMRPDFYPFYLSRSKLYDATDQQAVADIGKALEIGKSDWRTGLYVSDSYARRGNWIKSEEIARQFYLRFPQNYILGLHYAGILERNNKYSICLDLLEHINVLPNEGATDGKTVWKNANMGRALDLIKDGKYRKALAYVEQARQWPVNLGVGKPYVTDERLEDFTALQCYKKLKDDKSARTMMNEISNVAKYQDFSSELNSFLTAWVLKENGKKDEGDSLMKKLLETNPSSLVIQWAYAVYSNDQDNAGSLIRKIGPNNRPCWFLNRLFSEQYNLPQ